MTGGGSSPCFGGDVFNFDEGGCSRAFLCCFCCLRGLFLLCVTELYTLGWGMIPEMCFRGPPP